MKGHFTYNLRNRPATLSESGYKITLDYDASSMRRHTVINYGNTLVKEKTRISDLYELETTPTPSRRLDYINAEGGLVAVHVSNGSADSLYYVLTDRLGSWEKVMDDFKNTVQQTHFDPWGNRMSYTAWNTRQTQVAFPFSRGFTGHEHYDRFKIINANARLYDPVIGRFFSPDPYVQAPDFTQSFNRYSYCMNNPVMYRDPYGYYVTYGGNHYDPNGPLEQSIVDGHVAYVLPEVTITPDDNTSDTWNEFVYNPSTNSGGYTDWNYLNYGNNSNSSNGSGGSGSGGNISGATKPHNYLKPKTNNPQPKLHLIKSFIFSYDGQVWINPTRTYNIEAGQHVQVIVKNESMIGVQLSLQDITTYHYERNCLGFEQMVFSGKKETFSLLPKTSNIYDFYRFDYSPIDWQFEISSEISDIVNVKVYFYSEWEPGMPVDPNHPKYKKP